MRMSIDEAMNELKTQIRYYKDFWGADASDYVIDTFNTAVSVMQKYQKIQEIYQKWNEVNDFSYNQVMRKIGEVIEDGKID